MLVVCSLKGDIKMSKRYNDEKQTDFLDKLKMVRRIRVVKKPVQSDSKEESNDSQSVQSGSKIIQFFATDCQFCGDSGLCTFCDRGRDEIQKDKIAKATR